jgi:acetylornithine aminotransferase
VASPSARRQNLATPGSQARHFGGNPVSCAAALAVIDTIEADGLLDTSRPL